VSKVIGVDAAAGEWLGIMLVDGSYASAELVPTAAELLRLHPDAQVVAVDIPIGLPAGRFRPADAEARRFIGASRAPSVFAALPAEVLAAETYADAVAIAQKLLGKGMSAQSFALKGRILEVAEVAAHDQRVVEVHPEVSFRAMRGEPLRHSKHSWSGIAERRALLASAGILLPDDLPGGGRVAPDDVVDAAAAAWSALRVAQGRSRTLPGVRSSDPAQGGVIYF
jgi:predicted RNase H-like nuclease